VYVCQVCNRLVGPRVPMRKHTVYRTVPRVLLAGGGNGLLGGRPGPRPDTAVRTGSGTAGAVRGRQEIAMEYAVCGRCGDLLGTGLSMAAVRARRFEEEPPVATVPVAVPKARPLPVAVEPLPEAPPLLQGEWIELGGRSGKRGPLAPVPATEITQAPASAGPPKGKGTVARKSSPPRREIHQETKPTPRPRGRGRKGQA